MSKLTEARLTSRIMGITEGFDAAASTELKESEAELAKVEEQRDALALNNERLRGLLIRANGVVRARGWTEFAAEIDQALAAPTPAAVEQHRAERELVDCVMAYMDSTGATDPDGKTFWRMNRAVNALRALRDQRTATPELICANCGGTERVTNEQFEAMTPKPPEDI